ncbi:MAG: D-2-hydroxyacid dehydrogenase [Deltaproteobacteria bacterium]|nr:D-2-hydroxyacid dehydrogenase [Deltaproteobacteria bacterium]
MMKKNRVLILTRDPDPYVRLIAALDLPDLDVNACRTPREAATYVDSCNIILGEPKRIVPLMAHAGCLEWIQSAFAGVEALVAPPPRSDYVLTRVEGIFGTLMSEYVFAYILALERNLFQAHEYQKNREWSDMPYRSLTGLLLGICGLGSIGMEIARTADCFGMKVWGYRRSGEPVPGVDRVFGRSGFTEFLSGPDYVVVTLPHTMETVHIFDDTAFQAMKPSAVLINVGRGTVVSEHSLVRAVTQHRIRGAVLDVFEQEPLPKESRLWELPNVFITPHHSAISFPKDVVPIFAENYRRFTAGLPLMHVVDFKRGY